MKTLNVILLIFINLAANAQCDSVANQSNNYLALELDPAPFILGGCSFSVKYSPEKFNHIAFTGSVYCSKFPDRMMSKSNYENGFRNLRINTSYALFADYFIKQNRTGFYFGPSVFLYSKSVGTIASSEVADFKSIYPNLRIGYVYKPFKRNGFYINPWFNFGKELALDNNNSIAGKEFSSNPFSYILAIHLGYQITF